MRPTWLVPLVLLTALIAVPARLAAADATLRVHGSSSLMKLLKPKQADLEQAIGAKLELVGNGVGRGLQDLLDGSADLAAVNDLDSSWKALPADEQAHHAQADYQVSLVTATTLQVIINRDNPLAALTPDQLTGLLTGTIHNWHEIGGNDVPVVVVLPFPGDGARVYVQKVVLKDAAFTPEAKVLQLASQQPPTVAQLPGGVSVLSALNVTSQVKAVPVGMDLALPLDLVCAAQATDLEKRFIAAATAALKP
jgi:phosphate transport system substrate-binding protein